MALLQFGHDGGKEPQGVALDVAGEHVACGEHQHTLILLQLTRCESRLTQETVHALIVVRGEEQRHVAVDKVHHLLHFLHVDLCRQLSGYACRIGGP